MLNPGDAQRLEDQVRRNGRPQEERYWRDYRVGLESPGRYPRDYRDRDPIPASTTTVIGAAKLI
jgi:hypothetical protein